MSVQCPECGCIFEEDNEQAREFDDKVRCMECGEAYKIGTSDAYLIEGRGYCLSCAAEGDDSDADEEEAL